MINHWLETTNCDLKDIYDADEFGLFYQCLFEKTLYLKSEKYTGGKLSKFRLTEMVAANALGEQFVNCES